MQVFYDKPVFNIPLQSDSLKRNNCDSSDEASGSNSNSNQGSDDELIAPPQEDQVRFNIGDAEAAEETFAGDVEQALQEIADAISRLVLPPFVGFTASNRVLFELRPSAKCITRLLCKRLHSQGLL